MKNYYSTVDGIRLTFSDIEEDRDGFDIITFYFERENIEKKYRWSYFDIGWSRARLGVIIGMEVIDE